MRKFILAVVLLLAIFFLFGRFAEMQQVAETLRRGDWRYILLALCFEALWLVNVAATFRSIYRALGIEEKIENLIPTVASANFVNIIAPSGGVGGVAVFLAAARKRNYSAALATVAGALFLEFDYLGFLSVLSLGLIVLVRRNDLHTTEIIASAIMVAIALVLAILLYLGMRSEQAFSRALGWIAHQVNRLVRPFTHREYLSEERAREFAHDAAEGLRDLHQNPGSVRWPLLLALSSKGLLICILFFVFRAFQVPVSVGTLIVGYSITFLFYIVSPTPAGIGIVEGILTLVLSSMYIPFEVAAVIAIAYRGITFWLPLLVGMIAFHWTERETNLKSPFRVS